MIATNLIGKSFEPMFGPDKGKHFPIVAVWVKRTLFNSTVKITAQMPGGWLRDFNANDVFIDLFKLDLHGNVIKE